MNWIRIVNLALIVILVLVLRKLIWCLRWLWCYHHGQEVPDPISLLPQQSGRVFDAHVASVEEDEEV